MADDLRELRADIERLERRLDAIEQNSLRINRTWLDVAPLTISVVTISLVLFLLFLAWEVLKTRR